MKGTILDKIVEAKKLRIAAAKNSIDIDSLVERAGRIRADADPNAFKKAVSDRTQINVIAEFKRASPSKGMINDMADAESVARSYESGGAAAISVLTEEDFFKGTLEDLRIVRRSAQIPILRKDFIFDPFQIYEAAEAGADAILLIAAMLDDEVLATLQQLAEETLGIDALVEVHTLDELERVKPLGVKLIGVNNRDLLTFNVSLEVSRDLIRHAPADAVMIAESGLRTREDLIELHDLGFSGFLIGEALMRSDEPTAAVSALK